MADTAVTQTDQTGPLDAGHTTSEHALAKFVTILASVIAVLGTVTSFLAMVSPVFAGFPAVAKWVAIGGVLVAAFTQFAYGLQRTVLKVTAIKYGAEAAAAPVVPGAGEAAAAELGK